MLRIYHWFTGHTWFVATLALFPSMGKYEFTGRCECGAELELTGDEWRKKQADAEPGNGE